MQAFHKAFAGSIFSFLLFSLPLHFLSADVEAVPAKNVQTYDELLRAIHEVRQADRPQTESGLVTEHWTIGKLIEDHVREHKMWNDYSAEVNKRLFMDLPISNTTLLYMRQFARTYPEGVPSRHLGWRYYPLVFSVEDPVQREAILDQCEREHCSSPDLRKKLKKNKQKKSKVPAAGAMPQKFNLYRVVRAEDGPEKGKLVLDLGFSNEYELPGISAFKEGDILSCKPQAPCVLDRGANAGDLFAYAADITQIIDGDTLDAVINLGFGFITTHRLRLRGIDAAELDTEKGRAAKEFLFNQITQTNGQVILKAGTLDKYHRTLAEVWVGNQSVNQELLDKGLAVKMTE